MSLLSCVRPLVAFGSTTLLVALSNACSSPTSAPDTSPFIDGGQSDAPREAGNADSVASDVSTADAVSPPDADFYVAPTGSGGSDTNPGTLAAPFATFERARTAVRTLPTTRPRTVVFRGGSYPLTTAIQMTSADSGSMGATITYAAYPGEAPIFTGGVVVSGWTAGASGIWTATAPASVTDFTQMWVDAQRRHRVRTTESSYLINVGPVTFMSTTPPASPPCPHYYDTAPSSTVSHAFNCLDRFRFTGNDIDPTWSGLSDATHPIEIVDFEDWTIARLRLASVDASNVAYLTGTTAGAGFYGFIPGHRYLVENVSDALTANPSAHAGSFYFSTATHTISYVPLPGENMTTATVVVPQTEQFVVVPDSLSDVTFQGLHFEYSNYVLPPEGFASDSGEEDQNVSETATGRRLPAFQDVPMAVMSLASALRVTVDGCEFAHLSAWGVELLGASASPPSGSESLRIQHSAIWDLGGGGVRIGVDATPADTDSNVAQYAHVIDTIVSGGSRYLAGVAIWIANSHHDTIEQSEIADFYNIGIDVGHALNFMPSGGPGLVHDDVVRACLVHDIGKGVTSDMGGVKGCMSLGLGNQIVDNVIHDVTHYPGDGGYGGNGIYLDQGSSFVEITGNLVYRVSAAGFIYNPSTMGTWIPAGTPNHVSNDIFAFASTESVLRAGLVSETHLDFTVDHTIFYWDELNEPAMDPRSPLAGEWVCSGTGYSGDCSDYFAFSDNVYFDAASPAPPWSMITGNPMMGFLQHTFTDWQTNLHEDANSTSTVDPQFANVSQATGTYDFTLLPGSPALAAGFVPLHPELAGRTTTTIVPALVPPGFPERVPAHY